MNAFTREVTDNSFDSEVIQAIRPVLVYYWADWSEECRYMGPIIDSIAESARANLQVALLDVDANPRVARTCLIQMVPTMILFIRGAEVERIEGVTNEKHLSSSIGLHFHADSPNEIDNETGSIN